MSLPFQSSGKVVNIAMIGHQADSVEPCLFDRLFTICGVQVFSSREMCHINFGPKLFSRLSENLESELNMFY
jgi:hypothetical protein